MDYGCAANIEIDDALMAEAGSAAGGVKAWLGLVLRSEPVAARLYSP